MSPTEATTAEPPAIPVATENAPVPVGHVEVRRLNVTGADTCARLVTGAALVFGMALACTAFANPRANNIVSITPHTMARIATIDPRYQSYNVEMAEVIGGNFWKPYTPASIAAMKAGPAKAAAGVAGQDTMMFQARPPIDLSNARLRKLAAALGPAYVRVSGTWANSAYFHDADGAPPATAPKGFQGVLTRAEWKDVMDFARAVDAKLVTSFAISAGVRDSHGVWTPDQARRLAAYTKAIGGTIAAAEFFNEPDMLVYGGAPKGYDAADYARDFAVFRRFAAKDLPDMKVVGPGSVGEGVLMPSLAGNSAMKAGFVSTKSMLEATPPPKYDVFSYHFYGAASFRCAAMGAGAQTTAADALSEAWLVRTEKSYDFYVKGLRDRYEPGTPVWITETADAACGGNPWAGRSWTAFVISTSSGGWRDMASRWCSTTRWHPANTGCSIRAPSSHAPITGSHYCGTS